MGLSSRTVYWGRTAVSMSSAGKSIAGLWKYYLVYARTRGGIHAVATAALTVFGLLMYFHRGFIVLAVVSYVLPPVYLYLAGDDPERASTRETDEDDDTDTDFDGRDIGTGADGTDTDADGADADADGADADTDADGTDIDADGDDLDSDTDGSDADADADGANADGVDADIDN